MNRTNLIYTIIMQTTCLTFDQYPFLLQQIRNPPKFLDCAGAWPPPNDHKYLCVIGAREHSEYGQNVCQSLIAGLKGYPIIVVSGLAIGIDSIAHEAALNNGLKTISFPGSGLDQSVLYPPCHLSLAKKIIASGNTLLSPFERHQPGAHWTFPTRNRLMAGLSHATLIIEGCRGSGTLLTADYALEFDRDVLIVPGSIFSDLSYGPHMLYRRGAIPITSSEEILEALGILPRVTLDKVDSNLSKEEEKILETLQYSPLSATALMEKTGFNTSQMSILISQLELAGLIVQERDVCKIINRNNK